MPFVPALAALGWFLLSELLSGCGDSTTEPTDDKDDDLPKKPTGSCFKPEVYSQYLPPEETAYYPLALHRIARSDGSGAFGRSAIEERLKTLNQAFAPMNVQFYVSVMETIADDKLYEKKQVWFQGGDFAEFAVSEAINIYLMRDMAPFGHAERGYAIAIAQDSVSHVWPHEMGHFFGGLSHTHDTNAGKELADGSNCEKAGDRICDTPADPGPSPTEEIKDGCVVKDCVVIACPTDPNGAHYYPDITNYMGYYRACGSQFSPEQQQSMLCYSERNFSDLRQSQPQFILTEIPYLSVGCDETSAPSIQKALDEISSGGTVEVCDGIYYENLSAFGGAFTLLGKRGDVVVDGNQQDSVLIVGGGADLSIRHISFQNGLADFGGGIQIHDSELLLESVTIQSNEAYGFGGAVLVSKSNVSIQGGSISGNSSTKGAIHLKGLDVSSSLSFAGVNWDAAGDNQASDISIANGLSYSGLTESDQLFCSSATGVCE